MSSFRYLSADTRETDKLLPKMEKEKRRFLFCDKLALQNPKFLSERRNPPWILYSRLQWNW